MSSLKSPPPARLIVSLFAGQMTSLETARGALADLWGPMDWQSPVLAFGETHYYDREFGPGLQRIFVSFAPLLSQDRLANVKLDCRRLERQWSVQGQRRVNIDPGLVTAERLVLATGKNFAHRICLGMGVFADLTLLYRRGTFTPLAWTYPDYGSAEVIGLMNEVRALYLRVLREGVGEPRRVEMGRGLWP